MLEAVAKRPKRVGVGWLAAPGGKCPTGEGRLVGDGKFPEEEGEGIEARNVGAAGGKDLGGGGAAKGGSGGGEGLGAPVGA